MSVITFHTTIRDGLIQIPAEYRDHLPSEVQVIVMPDAVESTAVDFIAYLIEHPIDCPDFHPIPREQLYERT